jgi:hypothetical protein
MKQFGISLLLLIIIGRASSQQQAIKPPVLHAEIKVKAKSYGDSIVIRWAPTDAWAWVLLNNTGYVVERTDYSDPTHPHKEVLATVRPWTLDKFKSSFGRNDKYAAIAAQALYGKNFTTGIRQGQAAYADQAAVLKDRHAFVLQASDYDGRVAIATGLKWIDSHAGRDKFYSYRIYPAAKTQGIIDTGKLLVQNIAATLPAAPEISELIGLDRLVELHWNRYQQEQYSGFMIEKSTDGQHFTAINSIPYFSSLPDSSSLLKDTLIREMYDMLKLNHIMMDSVKENYTTYYYRIKGINAFAEWSAFSKPLAVMTRDMKPPALAVVSKPEWLDKNRIKLQWLKNEIEGDFKGYTVARAINVQGPYELLTKNMLDKKATNFIDENAREHEQNFYIVTAFDTSSNQAASYPVMGLIPDNVAPAAPVGLTGTIDKKGYVYLNWKAGKETDIKGYKIYFSNSDAQTPSQITLEPVTDTVYTDTITLKTLTKDIYYQVVAVDYNNNHSEYSSVARLRKPDIVPPMPPVAGNVDVSAKAVSIEWMQSSSEDAIAYLIYRSERKGAWQRIARIKHDGGKTSFTYTDTTARPMISYMYVSETIDEDSLHSSRSNPVPATIKTLQDQPPIAGLTAAYDNKTKKLKLNWQYRQNGNYFFVIYRGMGSEPVSKYSSAGNDQSEWSEYLDGKPGSVKYAIQAVFRDMRGDTKLSAPVSVTITQ